MLLLDVFPGGGRWTGVAVCVVSQRVRAIGPLSMRRARSDALVRRHRAALCASPHSVFTKKINNNNPRETTGFDTDQNNPNQNSSTAQTTFLQLVVICEVLSSLLHLLRRYCASFCSIP